MRTSERKTTNAPARGRCARDEVLILTRLVGVGAPETRETQSYLSDLRRATLVVRAARSCRPKRASRSQTVPSRRYSGVSQSGLCWALATRSCHRATTLQRQRGFEARSSELLVPRLRDFEEPKGCGGTQSEDGEGVLSLEALLRARMPSRQMGFPRISGVAGERAEFCPQVLGEVRSEAMKTHDFWLKCASWAFWMGIAVALGIALAAAVAVFRGR